MIPLSRPIIGHEEIEAVTRVLTSGMLAQGPEVEAFEEEFSRHVAAGSGQSVHAVAVANGTMALQLALSAIGIGPGDEVIVPSFTFIATANAVRGLGAVPVFADVDGETFTLDADSAASMVTSRTAAIMPVHLYGHPADMGAINSLAARHGLAVVEDAAQAHGASLGGRRAGSFATGCFSFYPTKNMTSGEGGMVTTRDGSLADRMRLIRNHGMRGRYEYETFGTNLRMTDMAAALGRVQLRHLDAWNEGRRRNAAWLDAHLHSVATPKVRPNVVHAYHQYTVCTDDRDALTERLRAHGIGHGVYYPVPVHRTAPYAAELDLPVTERLARQVLSLPVRPDLTREELAGVAEAVNG
jgi:dTDP-4-amino-4,6-dideoxygalactose transaminase